MSPTSGQHNQGARTFVGGAPISIAAIGLEGLAQNDATSASSCPNSPKPGRATSGILRSRKSNAQAAVGPGHCPHRHSTQPTTDARMKLASASRGNRATSGADRVGR